MYKIILDRRVIKTIQKFPPKHRMQIKNQIIHLQEEAIPHDSQTLKGYEPYRRCDCGEYRIVYRLDSQTDTVYVLLVGKRNGEEVYKQLKNLFSQN